MNPRTEHIPGNVNLPPGFEYPDEGYDPDEEWDCARDAYDGYADEEQEGNTPSADRLDTDHRARTDETSGVGEGL